MNVFIALFAGVQLLGLLAILLAWRRAPIGAQTEREFVLLREAPSVADPAPACGAVVRVSG